MPLTDGRTRTTDNPRRSLHRWPRIDRRPMAIASRRTAVPTPRTGHDARLTPNAAPNDRERCRAPRDP